MEKTRVSTMERTRVSMMGRIVPTMHGEGQSIIGRVSLSAMGMSMNTMGV